MTGLSGGSLGFLNEYAHALDDKGRLTMPSRLRAAIGDPFVLTRGLDGCLFAYSLPTWHRIAQQLDALPFTSAAPRGFSRLFFSGASEASFDRQGRFLVPANLRQYAGLSREAVIIGVSTRLEVWSPERWREFCAKTEPEYQALAENLFRS